MTGAPEIVRLARVGSTMDALHELAQAGAPEGTAVVAAVQESGRGSRGRTWSSPPGGLWLSVLARPAEAGLELLSLRVGLVVAGVLERLGVGGALRLKWPNDLMLGERKFGGVLCEARWQGAMPAWVTVGVGLNVANAPPEELAAVATYLASSRPGLTPEALVVPVIDAVRAIDPVGGSLTPSELAELRPARLAPRARARGAGGRHRRWDRRRRRAPGAPIGRRRRRCCAPEPLFWRRHRPRRIFDPCS